MGNYINYNGRIIPSTQPVFMAGNRNFQYGDGLFETMRLSFGKILFARDHFERLFAGLKALKFAITPDFTPHYLKAAILNLCLENRFDHARIRLTVFRDTVTSTNHNPDQPCFLVECWDLNEEYSFNSEQFSIGLFAGLRKTADDSSSYKTCSYLPYAVAAVAARQQGFNDCLILNTAGRICDSSIANVFCVRNDEVLTPPLTEGCIAGIMRKHLLKNIMEVGLRFAEVPLTVQDLTTATEVFLTNMIRGIIPVTNFQTVSYSTNVSEKLFSKLVNPLTKQ